MTRGAVAAIAALLVLGVASCGDDGGDGGAEVEVAEGPEAQPTPAAGSEPEGTGGPGADGATGATDAPEAGEDDVATDPPVETARPGAGGGGGGLVGTWQLEAHTFDEDADYRLGDAERAAAEAPWYGLRTIELREDGTCLLVDDEEQTEGTCRLAPCEEVSMRPDDCEALEPTGGRMLWLEPEPTNMTMIMGSLYGVLGLTDDEMLLKDMTGEQGTIYIYRPG